jgi:hypothetical protein
MLGGSAVRHSNKRRHGVGLARHRAPQCAATIPVEDGSLDCTCITSNSWALHVRVESAISDSTFRQTLNAVAADL